MSPTFFQRKKSCIN